MPFTVLSGSNVDYYSWISPYEARIRIISTSKGSSNFQLVGLAVEADMPTVPSPPTVSNFIPTVSSQIYSTSSISFDVQDPPAGSFSAIILHAKYPSGRWDVVYDGSAFSSEYSGSVTAISEGYTFVVSKINGWTESPTLHIVVVDNEGTPVT